MPDQNISDSLGNQLGLRDQAVFGLGLNLSESLSLSDSQAQILNLLIGETDSLELSDSTNQFAQFLNNQAESLSLSDSAAARTAGFLNFSDTLDLIENLGTGVGSKSIELIDLSDSVSVSVTPVVRNFPYVLLHKGLRGVV